MIVDSIPDGAIASLEGKITYYSNQLVHNDMEIETKIPLGVYYQI